LNGGHFQYFENWGLELIPDTIRSLKEIGAKQQAQIIEQAYMVAKAHSRGDIETAEEFVNETVGPTELANSNRDYEEATPSVHELLVNYVNENRDAFFDIKEDV
jgi:hypothetical protein